MRNLVYLIAATLDGFIAGTDGGDPTGPGGFWPISEDYVAHLVSEFPETLPGAARQAFGITDLGTRFDTVLEGRKSYDVGLAAGVTDAYPHLRHLVFSRTLQAAPDPAVTVVSGDAVSAVRRLKEQDGDGKDIWLVGGGELAGALSSEIDQIILKVAPVTIGQGIPLFGRHVDFGPLAWRLVEHTALESGTLILTYARTAES